MMKPFFIFLFMMFLSSCVLYEKDTKHVNNIDIAQKSTSLGYLGTIINYDYYTKENIIKNFGKPIYIEKTKGKEILHYQTNDRNIYTMISILYVIPIVLNSDDGKYNLSFELENKKLTNIKYENIKNKTVGIFFLIPMNVDNVINIKHFDNNKCSIPSSSVPTRLFDVIPSSGKIKYEQSCARNLLYNTNVFSLSTTDDNLYRKGYTKFSLINIYVYESNLYSKPINDKEVQEALKEEYKKSLIKRGSYRVVEYTVNEKDIKTKNFNCRIYMKTGLDYQAFNKGHNKFLINDIYGALCFSKAQNIVYDIQHSNKYPEDMKKDIDTYKELVSIIEAIQIN